MTTLNSVNGIDYLVDVFSLADLKAQAIDDASKMTMAKVASIAFSTGGFYTIILKAENVDNLNKTANLNLETDRDYQVVCILREMMDELGALHSAAIFEHEIGHIVNGDLEAINEESNMVTHDSGCKFLINAENELRADEYSASIHGKEVMREALSKVPSAMQKVLRDINKPEADAYAELIGNTLANDSMYMSRLLALSC